MKKWPDPIHAMYLQLRDAQRILSRFSKQWKSKKALRQLAREHCAEWR
jgi:hypothetical protein